MIAGAALALLLGAAPCLAPPRADGPPPWTTGETLTYEMDLLGMVRAGTVDLSVEPPLSRGKVVPLRARARTDAAVANVRSVAAVALSWVDARTLRPERYREEAQEDGVHKLGDARIPPEGDVVIEYRSGDRTSTGRYARQGEVVDAVSAVYRLRASRLSPGDTFCLDLVARGAFWRVRGKVAAKTERVKTPLGRLETFRVDVEARRAVPADSPARPVHLWFTTDARRLLVAAVGEVDAGPVRMMLTGVRGARR